MFAFKRMRLWIGISISLFFMAVLLWSIDIQHAISELKSANYIYVGPAIVMYFLSLYFRSIRWKILLSHMKDIPSNRLYPVVVIGYMANNLLPIRLGELVRAYYLASRESISAASSLASIAVERVYDGLTLLVFCVVSVTFLMKFSSFSEISSSSNTAPIVFASIAIAMFVGSLLALTFMGSSKFIIFRKVFLKIIPNKVEYKINRILEQFLEGLNSLKSPKTQMTILLFSIPAWLSECGCFLFIGYSFNLDTYFSSTSLFVLAIMLVTATSNLITAIPSSVGGIGPFEVAAQQTLVVLGLDTSLAAAYSAFVHIAIWIPVNIVGLLLLWNNNIPIRLLFSQTSGEESDTCTDISQDKKPVNNKFK